MNIAIVDGNEADRLRLERILKQYAVMNQLDFQIDLFSNGETFLQNYQPFQHVVVFLDIHMDGISGIEVAKKLREKDDDTILAFVTNSEDHRPEAFSVFAAAYLIKPCPDEQVFRLMDHILRRRTKTAQRFSFTYDRKEYSLPFADLVSIETDGNYIRIKNRDGESFRTRMTFLQAQAQLDSRFLILMKGILVNMDYIEQIHDTLCIMRSGDKFPLRVKAKRELKQTWQNYKFASIRREAELPGDESD